MFKIKRNEIHVLKYIANFLNNINLTFTGTEAYNQEWLLLPFEIFFGSSTITGIPIRGEKYWKLCITIKRSHFIIVNYIVCNFPGKKFCIEG